jgi:hypothetical protein
VDTTDNLQSLHRHEEELRVQSLEAINARADLHDHLQIISDAMNVIYAFSHDHAHQSDDELTLQLFGIRLFNAAGAALKLALSGYYQKAIDSVRDILETGFLLDYLTTYPAKIAEWKAADKKARIAHFGPGIIRNALDQRDGYSGGARKKFYDLLSEHASHASYPGFSLVLNSQNLGQVGPFFDHMKLAVCITELATRLTHAAVILVSDHEGDDVKLLITRANYIEAVTAWRAKYFLAEGSTE